MARNAFRSDESRAKRSSDWLGIAEKHLETGNLPDTRRCVLKAESKANYSYEFCEVVKLWMKLNSPSDAKRCLIKSESFASGDDWVKIATLWGELGSGHDARRCMAIAEKEARTTSNWGHVVDAWVKLESDPDAKRSLLQVEPIAVTLSDWLSVTKHWLTLKSESDCRRCLSVAEKMATTVADWLEIAKTWERLPSADDVTRCFFSAESIADDSSDWVAIATQRYYMHDERSAIENCAVQAEATAMSSQDWVALANVWGYLGRDTDKQRCREMGTFLADKFDIYRTRIATTTLHEKPQPVRVIFHPRFWQRILRIAFVSLLLIWSLDKFMHAVLAVVGREIVTPFIHPVIDSIPVSLLFDIFLAISWVAIPILVTLPLAFVTKQERFSTDEHIDDSKWFVLMPAVVLWLAGFLYAGTDTFLGIIQNGLHTPSISVPPFIRVLNILASIFLAMAGLFVAVVFSLSWYSKDDDDERGKNYKDRDELGLVNPGDGYGTDMYFLKQIRSPFLGRILNILRAGSLDDNKARHSTLRKNIWDNAVLLLLDAHSCSFRGARAALGTFCQEIILPDKMKMQPSGNRIPGRGFSDLLWKEFSEDRNFYQWAAANWDILIDNEGIDRFEILKSMCRNPRGWADVVARTELVSGKLTIEPLASDAQFEYLLSTLAESNDFEGLWWLSGKPNLMKIFYDIAQNGASDGLRNASARVIVSIRSAPRKWLWSSFVF